MKILGAIKLITSHENSNVTEKDLLEMVEKTQNSKESDIELENDNSGM